ASHVGGRHIAERTAGGIERTEDRPDVRRPRRGNGAEIDALGLHELHDRAPHHRGVRGKCGVWIGSEWRSHVEPVHSPVRIATEGQAVGRHPYRADVEGERSEMSGENIEEEIRRARRIEGTVPGEAKTLLSGGMKDEREPGREARMSRSIAPVHARR